MRLTLCHPLESRDGTLNADSKMKNMVVENVEGELVAVKRPGVTNRTELAPGLAQGLFSLNGLAYAIVDDTLLNVEFPSEYSSGGSYQMGASVSYGGRFYWSLTDTDENTPAPEDTDASVYPYPVVGNPGIKGGAPLTNIAGTSGIFWGDSSPDKNWSWTFNPSGHTESGFGSAIAATQAAANWGGGPGYTYVAFGMGNLYVSDPYGNPWFASYMGAFSFRYSSIGSGGGGIAL